MRAWVRTLIAPILASTLLGAISERVREPQGVTDTEIRIGNVMPYSGNLQVFGQIGKAEAAGPFVLSVLDDRNGNTWHMS